MADYYFYCMLALEPAFFDAMKYGSLREKCKMILLVAMNDKNTVKVRINPTNKKRGRLVEAMAALTETTQRSIELQLNQLTESGFGKWDKKNNVFVVHRNHARKGNRKSLPDYDGVHPQHSPEEQGVLAQLWLNFESRQIIRDKRKDDMNKAMLKKMDDINETLNTKLSESNQRLMDMYVLMRLLLQKPDDKETREKIERHLRLVENIQ